MNYENFFVKATMKLRGHNWKLFKKRANKICWENFFSQRVVDPWNKLFQSLDLESVVCSSTGLTRSWTQKNMDNKSFIAYTKFIRDDDDKLSG